jgi:UTP-glucose-1-phosphate uridylyltransferase
MKPSLLILAAGMGSRFGGLKQMEPIGANGECILDYSIHDALKAGFGRVVFVIRPDFSEVFKRSLGDRFARHLPVDYVYQELDKLPDGFQPPAGREKPWGTGHAVLMGAQVIREPFAVINADDFYGQEGYAVLARRLATLDPNADRYAMVGYDLEATLSEHGTVSRGICTVDEGRLVTVQEHLKIEKRPKGAVDLATGREFQGQETVSLNFFGFTPAFFGHLSEAFVAFLKRQDGAATGEFQLPAVVDALIREQKAEVEVLRSRDAWFGITYREDKPRVSASVAALVAQGRYPKDCRA